jgi:hypothetical protein
MRRSAFMATSTEQPTSGNLGRHQVKAPMDTTELIIPPGAGATWEMAPGRSAALKITSDIAHSVMMFEEVAPTNTVTDLHIHHDSDEIADTFKRHRWEIVGPPPF